MYWWTKRPTTGWHTSLLNRGKACDVHGWGLRVYNLYKSGIIISSGYPVLSQLRRWCHLDAESRVMRDNYDIRWVFALFKVTNTLAFSKDTNTDTHENTKKYIYQTGKHIIRDNFDIR